MTRYESFKEGIAGQLTSWVIDTITDKMTSAVEVKGVKERFEDLPKDYVSNLDPIPKKRRHVVCQA